jgi:hypothetical protein
MGDRTLTGIFSVCGYAVKNPDLLDIRIIGETDYTRGPNTWNPIDSISWETPHTEFKLKKRGVLKSILYGTGKAKDVAPPMWNPSSISPAAASSAKPTVAEVPER